MMEPKESSIIIRDIESNVEMHAVEDLQKEVWRIPDLDVVPQMHLVAAKSVGGVLIGAFDSDLLVGFVYGFVGLEEGKANHHSHMLAIKPGYRNANLGTRLKFAQRERVLSQGLNQMTWTFDPLQGRNAHINFNKLGVVSNRYFKNFYGDDAASYLHGNGTDRLLVTWLLDSNRVDDRLNGKRFLGEVDALKPLLSLGEENSPVLSDLEEVFTGGMVSIEIPDDVLGIEKRDRELAARWRQSTGTAFINAIEAGYLVKEFYRNVAGERNSGIYVLTAGTRLNDIW